VDLASFGEDLRREREIRGISLKEISDATKISRRFLEAIERNDHGVLPAPVFTRGFVREYARYVGLNADDLVSRYNQAATVDERIETPPVIERYPQTPVRDIAPRPARKRGIPRYAFLDRNLLALLLLAAALGAVAWWAIHEKGLRSTEVVTPPQRPPAARPAPAAEPILVPPSVAEPENLRLTIDVSDSSWVIIEADGKTVINREMYPGDRETIEAQEAFRLRTIGNAAGVSMRLNGTPLPPLGRKGQVIRNHVLDREYLEELRRGAGEES
jgi:cytoskeletal protein RodZ